MSRPGGRGLAAFLLACLLACVAVTVGAAAGRPSIARADDGCLPPPELLFSDVAQLAGTNSQLWADLQQVEQNDDAAGTSGSGQVIQDLLAVVDRDGFQWDCQTNELVGPAPGNIPVDTAIPTIPIPTIPASPTGGPSSTAAAGRGTGTGSGAGQTTTSVSPSPGDTSPADTAAPGSGAGGTGLPGDSAGASSQGTAPLALGANPSSTAHFPTLVVILLVLLTLGIIVAVIARQFSRR